VPWEEINASTTYVSLHLAPVDYFRIWASCTFLQLYLGVPGKEVSAYCRVEPVLAVTAQQLNFLLFYPDTGSSGSAAVESAIH
jgi:hypothetical protein